MKNLTHLLFVLLCICLPVAVHAQKDKDKDDDDSKYLAGAVPEVDGRQSGIYQRFQHSRHVSRYNLFPSAEVDGRAFGEE